MYRTLGSVFLLLAGGAALSAPPSVPAAVPAAPAPPPAPSKAAETFDLVHQLERLAAGRPLPVAAVDEAAPLRAAKPPPDVAGKPLLNALQDIADAFSDPAPQDLPGIFQPDAERRRTAFAPFAFPAHTGNVWTIARDRRMEDATPQEPKDMLDGMPDFELASIFFPSLDAGQLKAATTRGLRWSDLSDAQKTLEKALLARPFAVYRNDPNKAGDDKRVYEKTSETPLPVEQCVLHLYAGFTDLEAPTGKPREDAAGGTGELTWETYDLHERDLRVRLVRKELAWRPLPTPDYSPKIKPSDLAYDAPALAAPIGVQGVMPLEKVVAAAAAASRLPLKVDRLLGRRDAFVGDARLRCGDALRAIAYSFDGAWRKVGDVYLLTWDRIGSAAALAGADAGPDTFLAHYRQWKAAEKTVKIPGWETLAEKTLAAAPDLPLAPTSAQWDALAAPAPDKPWSDLVDTVFDRPKEVFAFTRLDPGQQEAVRRAMADRRTTSDSITPNAPFPAKALEKSHLDRAVMLAYLDIPGVGRVNVTRTLMSSVGGLNSTERALTAASKKLFDDAMAAKRVALAAAPSFAAYATRAVAPPPLTAAEWTRLLNQMDRKGLNAVYVPVLWDRQTLFPSAHFPLLSACHGENLLASVLAQAHARHIRVVAVLHALAWRVPGSGVHWLSQHPELVDVDAAGHTRRAWAAVHPLTPDSLEMGSTDDEERLWDALSVSDFVRPTAAGVRTRLLGVVEELKRYRALDGVALGHWTRLTNSGLASLAGADASDPTAPPDLGYTLPERAAFLEKQGVDPEDVESSPSRPDENADDADDKTDYYNLWVRNGAAQDADLAKAMLAGLEAAWPGRTQIFGYFLPNASVPLPEAGAYVNRKAQGPPGGAACLQVMPPVLPLPEPVYRDGEFDDTPPDLTPEQARQKRLDDFHATLSGGVPGVNVYAGNKSRALPPAKAIVLDFTGSPDLLWDGLALLSNK